MTRQRGQYSNGSYNRTTCACGKVFEGIRSHVDNMFRLHKKFCQDAPTELMQHSGITKKDCSGKLLHNRQAIDFVKKIDPTGVTIREP